MIDVFKELKEKIDKNVKGVHASILSESKIASNRFWIKTPALDLNRILSGSLNKGIQSRNLIAIVGPEHTFKSSFMVLCMVEAQKQGLKPVIIDTEGGITNEFCNRWGLDPKNVLYVYTPWVSEVKSVIAQIKDTEDEKYVIGIDSVGGLDRLKSFTDAVGGVPKADQGLLQKEIRSTLKLLLNVGINQNSIGIVCGHLYGKPSMIPMPDQIGGGKAMKLFPSVIINLKKEHIKENDVIIGTKITATTLKNRNYPPFQQATIKINYKDGIESYAGIIDLGIKAGMVNKSGSWYSYSEEKLGQGISKATKNINKFPNLIKEMEQWLSDTGYSTINNEIKEAEELLIKEEIKEEVKEPKKKTIYKKKK